MKKLRTVLCGCLILAVLCSSACTSNDPAEVYPEVAERYTEAAKQNGVKLVYDRTMKLSDGTRTVTYGMNGEAAFRTGEDDALLLSQSGDVKIDLNVGSSFTVPVKSYYCEGKLYSEINESRYVKTMNVIDALTQLGPVCSPLVNLSVSDFKELTLKDNEDDTRTISVMISAEAIKKIVGLQESWRRIADLGEGEGKIEFQDVRGFFVIRDELPVKQSLTIIGSIKTADRSYSITEEMVLAISSEEAVTVNEPAASQYVSLD